MIIVVALQQWSEYTIAGWDMDMDISMGKAKGFLPVYETLEEARADFPTAPVKEIRLRRKS